jgi:NADPH:quinone reductase-like Zn-dependent oxidoreductase
VEKIGTGVTAFKPGDEVYGMVGGVGGLQGALAQAVDADADLLAHKPTNLSMREAAALPLVVITSWEALMDQAKVHEGQSVLIHAGTGGVGHVAVQIARAHGAKVFATVSEGKRAIVEGFGATAIDYRAASVAEYVKAHTVGGTTLDASFVAVKPYTGRVVSALGWGTHSLAPLSFRSATYSGVFTLMPLLAGGGRAHHGWILAQAAALAEAGKLKPLLSHEQFSPTNIDEACARVESGSLGKVVIEM